MSANANDLLEYLASNPDFRDLLEKQAAPEAKRQLIAEQGFKITRADVEALQREAARRHLESPAAEFDTDDSSALTTVLACFWNDAAFWNPAFWADAFWSPSGYRTPPGSQQA
jgi:Nif11 domain